MRKLVLLNTDGALTEVDQKAQRREALALKAYIDSATDDEGRTYSYKVRLLPIVNKALEGTLRFPFHDEP